MTKKVFVKPLRYHQETIFFYLVIFLFVATLFSWARFLEPVSHPLTAVHAEPQKDGGTLG